MTAEVPAQHGYPSRVEDTLAADRLGMRWLYAFRRPVFRHISASTVAATAEGTAR